MKIFLLSSFIILIFSCRPKTDPNQIETTTLSAIKDDSNNNDILLANDFFTEDTLKKSSDTYKIIDYAKSLIGTPYLYGSTDINEGLDCSGFITAVYSHFNIEVPRSSVDFTNYGQTIPIADAEIGDLILFTGTDSTKRVVGHMGIITQTEDTIKFVHSTSGKAYGVTITPLNKYYQGRFVKIVRIEN